ncbi:MAG TPA: DUF2953 domain-containing protein [Polyangiaceae bacterium]|nr:DUF2953 domain-containing protein [Polyangiaceae bacterium]
MQLWLVLLASALCLGALAALAAIELEFEAQGVGEASGAWAAAFGLTFAGVLVSGVLAREQRLKLEVRILGRKLDLQRLRKRRAPKPPKEKPQQPSKPRRRLPIGLSEGIDLALLELRRIEVGRVDAAVTYGFRDIALTGRLAGALYALSGILPPTVHFNQTVKWDGAERWEASASGRVALWPGRVLFDVVWFMLRARWRRRSPTESREPSPEPSVLGGSKP